MALKVAELIFKRSEQRQQQKQVESANSAQVEIATDDRWYQAWLSERKERLEMQAQLQAKIDGLMETNQNLRIELGIMKGKQ